MLKMPRITMSAKWQGREEPLQMMAARIRAFLTLSRSPPGRSWHCIIPPRPETPEEAERFDRYCDLGANPAYVDDHVANARAASIEFGGNGTACGEDLFALRPGGETEPRRPHCRLALGALGRDLLQYGKHPDPPARRGEGRGERSLFRQLRHGSPQHVVRGRSLLTGMVQRWHLRAWALPR